MTKNIMTWKTKGMNRDLSVSAFNPEFSFENMNLRLSTNEGNTLMSWVNEKGTSEISLVEYDQKETQGYLDGICIGTAVLNEYLVMFMSKSDPIDYDCIYRLNYNEDKTVLRVKELYKGDLNFDVNHPIETLVSYESEHIQKVYWTDHKNQPRLINIAPDNDGKTYTDTSFDFVPTLKLKEDVKVVKVLGGGGMFAPGVIQYAFTYYNKHGQESNIFHVTPLYYLSHKDRGASPEEKVDNTFKITVTSLDTHFDYLRIYSIQRTSIDATPICKRIQDIEIGALQADEDTGIKSASYIDTGTSGNSIDPTELLYKGGSEINIGTMGQKDGTLFMGDITLLGNRQPTAEPAEGEEFIHNISIENDKRSFYVELESSDNYVYGNLLNAVNSYPTGGVSVPCSGFKHGDWYRCGIQLQDSLGRWTDPIFLDDIQIGNFPSITNQSGGGGEHSDEDLELVVRFVNNSGSYITMQNEITVGIEPAPVRSIRAAQEPIELTIKLDMPETMQFAPSSNELISGVISQGRQYTGSRFVALDGQETPASVKDADGNPTHAVTVAYWEDVKTVLSTSLEVICTSTTNPDDVPVPVPPDPPVPPTPTGDASYAEYTGGNGIKYVLHNNSGVEARFNGKVILNVSNNPNDWANSTQANANMHAPTSGTSHAYNDIIIAPGGTYTSPEITTIEGIYMPEVDFTDGTWYLMNTMSGVAGHPVFLYTREYSRSRKKVSGSNHMYAATPTVNTKLLRGYTYHLNVSWVNPDAMLADENLTESDFLNNYTDSYAILAEGKEGLR